MTMHVACAADEAYVGHCGAMLHSLLAPRRYDDLVVHFLHPPELPAATGEDLSALVESLGADIELHPIDNDLVDGLPVMDRIPRVMWYRIFLPSLLPAVDRVLYLDADTLVIDDIEPLFDLPLDDAYVAAVPNVLEPAFAEHPRELGLPDESTYFNSGVLLLNLDAMRAGNCTQRITSFAREQHLLWPDQDALNVVLGPKCVRLGPRWNCMNSLYLFPQARDVFGADEVRAACDDPAIVHFEGPALAKPWHYLSKHPYRRAYAEHRAATPWPEYAIEGRSWKHRILKPLPTRTALTLMAARVEARARLGLEP